MKYSKKGFVAAWVGLVALAAVMLAISCSNELPTAIGHAEDQQSSTVLLNDFLNKSSPMDVLLSENCEELILEDEGGELLFVQFGANTGLFIPSGSLSKKTRIAGTAELLYVIGKNVVRFDFSPDGLQFEIPAILRVNGKHFKSSGEVSLFWLNSDTGLWELEAEGRIQNGVAEFQIHHFSKYAISD